MHVHVQQLIIRATWIHFLDPSCGVAGERNAARRKSPKPAPDQVLHIEKTSVITT